MAVHEGSLTFAGLLALGCGSRILVGAHHRDLAPFLLGSLATLGGHDGLFLGNFGFAPRGERHVHRNHMVKVVRLVGVNG